MSGLLAGFAEVDITPEIGLPISGVPLAITPPECIRRFAAWARCLIIASGEPRLPRSILAVCWLILQLSCALRSRPCGGLADSGILISCTHTHNAPYTIFDAGEPPDRSEEHTSEIQ